jgi:hypothetical protein
MAMTSAVDGERVLCTIKVGHGDLGARTDRVQRRERESFALNGRTVGGGFCRARFCRRSFLGGRCCTCRGRLGITGTAGCNKCSGEQWERCSSELHGGAPSRPGVGQAATVTVMVAYEYVGSDRSVRRYLLAKRSCDMSGLEQEPKLA